MNGTPSRALWELLGIAALIAVLAVSLRLLRYSLWLGDLDVEIYLVLVGAALLAAGVAVGRRVRRAGAKAPPPPDSPLTDREVEVLAEVAAGHSNQEIADRLFLSRDTVKSHLKNIYGKLGVKRRTQAVERGRALGLLP